MPPNPILSRDIELWSAEHQQLCLASVFTILLFVAGFPSYHDTALPSFLLPYSCHHTSSSWMLASQLLITATVYFWLLLLEAQSSLTWSCHCGAEVRLNIIGKSGTRSFSLWYLESRELKSKRDWKNTLPLKTSQWPTSFHLGPISSASQWCLHVKPTVQVRTPCSDHLSD